MPGIDAGSLDKRLIVEKRARDTSFTGTGKGTWTALPGKVWASVTDMLPSRGEKLAEGLNVATRPARVRMYRNPAIKPDMRFVLGDRVMQITAGPADFADDGMEFMVADYSTAGTGA